MRLERVFFRFGFISIELVIIASMILTFGAASTQRFVSQGQGSTSEFDKAFEHTKNVVEGGEGTVDDREIEYETVWIYGNMQLPELPEEITNYRWNGIGSALGYTAVIGASYMPEWKYQDTYVTNVHTGEVTRVVGEHLVWNNPSDNILKYNSYVLVENEWVPFDAVDYSKIDGYSGSFTLTNIDDYYWSNNDIYNEEGNIFMAGIKPEQKQVPVK